jgi:YbbR domain-containing protein
MRLSLGSLGTLLLSLLLALLVWLIAANQQNPFEERVLASPVEVKLTNLSDDLLIISPASARTTVTLRAPSSVWDTLTTDKVHVTADLSGLSAGTHEVALQPQLDEAASRVVTLSPARITVTLEGRATREVPIRLDVAGEPALGYEAGSRLQSVNAVQVSGPASLVDRVSEVAAQVSLAGLKNDLSLEVLLTPVDAAGAAVSGVALTPDRLRVQIPISQKLGYRDVAVRAVIRGQVAPGYRVTNITVAPLIITVSSSDPQQVSDLAGFIDTQPLNIGGKSDDVTERVALDLPEGVTPVGDPTVLVQVNIAAIESSLQIQRQLTAQGLEAGLTARFSPETVDVLLTGPLPLLESLKADDVQVIVSLVDLPPGTYLLVPEVVVLPQGLRAESVRPSPVEVIIELGATETVTPTPARGTPTPTRQP